jgi:hypothetical protein
MPVTMLPATMVGAAGETMGVEKFRAGGCVRWFFSVHFGTDCGPTAY